MDSPFPRDVLSAIPLFAPYLEVLSCVPLGAGQGRGAWRVTSPAGDHVLWLTRLDAPAERRRRERVNMEIAAAQGLAPPLLYADSGRGALVMPYLHGALGAETFTDRLRLDRVAALYAALHAGRPFEGTFCPFHRLDHVVERTAALPLPEVPDRTDLLAALEGVRAELAVDAPPPAPCHNAPHPHNLIDSTDGLRLIGWEDAGMADPDWEIGAFCVLARLTPDEEVHFLRRCHGSATGPRARRARLFQCVLRGIHAVQALDRTTTANADPAPWRAEAVAAFTDLRRRLEALSAPAPATPRPDRPTIFVSIASYRDPDCQNTLHDLFAKATHPERVFVGLCWQFVPGEDDDCFAIPYPRPDQVRVIDVHARDSRGACWARYQVQSLWREEDFVLQIDSHMRFAEGWDERLIAMHAACPSPKAVLSTYPPAFVPPDDLKPAALVRIRAKAFDKNGVLMFGSNATPLDKAPKELQRTPFIAAGLLFGPSAVITEVPYDPYLYFQGEEITLAARLFTHGWDVYIPNDAIAWHDYGKRPERPRHWHDGRDWGQMNEASFARVRHLFGMQASADAAITRDIARFGFGTARSLAEYEAFAEVDFVPRLVRGRATTLPAQAPDTDQQKAIRADIFGQIWRQNAWKVEETRSGRFATLDSTAALRAALPGLLSALGVRTLADAGCGDLHWLAGATPALAFYFGFDIVPEAVEHLATTFADRPNHFFRRADIVTDPLPACDAILCRDVLSHLPQAHAVAALRRFKASGSRLLIATTHTGSGKNPWISVGGWYPIDMTAPPFGLPPPRLLLDEKVGAWGKALGVWAMSDLPDWPEEG